MKKNAILFTLLFFTATLLAQIRNPEKMRFYTITRNESAKKKGLHLKEVVSDSRCPEDVTCVWGGEIKLVISVYRKGKFVNDETITISSMHLKENKKWFSKYLPSSRWNIKSITVLPYPKEAVPVNPKDYYIKIGYTK